MTHQIGLAVMAVALIAAVIFDNKISRPPRG